MLCCVYQVAPRLVAWPPGHLVPRPSSRGTKVTLRAHFFVPRCFCACMCSSMTNINISKTAVQSFLLEEILLWIRLKVYMLSIDVEIFMFALAATSSHLTYHVVITAAAAHPSSSSSSLEHFV